ncbi:MAG TPA: lipoyl(octanoyl) transferase LipB [Verrucomicrobiae bacterium]|nr:lipoyl(octanoyl) transferase LipB [Verrucomicrobiae bacterium]
MTTVTAEATAAVRRLGTQPYASTYQRMRELTHARTPESPDELWWLEHPPVFTQGQAGKAEHVLMPGDIPVVQSDRGGQVTYHGPGQLVGYVMVDLHRRGYGIRSLVTRLEQSMIECLAGYGITAVARSDAPGVYVDGRKIGSLGLRVRKGCTYHGLSLNVAMDLEPFDRINPCGLAGMRMTQTSDLGGPADADRVSHDLEPILLRRLSRVG